MSLAVLELNDQSLLIETDQGSQHAEPGFARLTQEGIETGEEARSSAWEQPQNSYNQYWNLLNQTPLTANEKWARHHADIAFAQLKHLWQGAGSPESLVMLAPGSFTDAQLSLLLGMAAALPCEPLAVIDSAVAACLEAQQDTLYIDMQMHQTVITRCRVASGKVSITDQEVMPDLGLIQVYNSVARYISNLLIDSARYDPLHTSKSEQFIFDHIPDWLTHLRWEGEVSALLETEQGELPFILRNDDLRRLVDERLINTRAFIQRHPGCELVLSQSSALLAGLADDLSVATEASQGQGIDYVLTHHPLILEQINGVYRVQSLQRGESSPAPVTGHQRLASHLLHGGSAFPLRKPVSIRVTADGLTLSNSLDKEADLALVLRNGVLETLQVASGLEIVMPANCEPGASLSVGGHRLGLIEVQDG